VYYITLHIDLSSSLSITVDCEGDWGGRTDSLQGITEGLPIILDCLKEAGLKGIFFLSTGSLDRWIDIAKGIQSLGHTIGSHGHEHRRFGRWLEWRLDYLQSMQILEKQLGLKRPIPYRAPKFSYVHPEHRYSNPKGHTSLLKHIWVKQPLQEILYLHPFDLVKPVTPPPNLFCAIWYTRWREAKERFQEIVREMAPSSSSA
jgi:hypothetical protein